MRASAIVYVMKKLATIISVVVIAFGMAPGYSSADDRAVWDDIESGSIKLQNEGLVSEGEGIIFQEVIILGEKGETEEAINNLNEFLRGNRNTSLREVSKEALAQLLMQRKDSANYAAKAARQPRTCDIELKVCKNGEIVGRAGRAYPEFCV